jgi:hypothetical protein
MELPMRWQQELSGHKKVYKLALADKVVVKV